MENIEIFKGIIDGSLTSITIPEGVEDITKYAMQYFENNFTELNVPSTVKNIDSSAFFYCSRLASINLSEGLIRIGVSAFDYTAITRLVVPDSVIYFGQDEGTVGTGLGGSPVGGCNDLAEIVIGKNVVGFSMKCFTQSSLVKCTFRVGK